MKTKYLNELLSTLGVTYIKLHQYHWYVEGPNFFSLHELFEKYYDETTEDLDEVAERMLAINLNPPSTLSEYIELSWVKEAPYTKKLSANEMVTNLVEDFTLLSQKLEEGLHLTEDDDVTNDILVGIKTRIDKRLWMLRAYLG